MKTQYTMKAPHATGIYSPESKAASLKEEPSYGCYEAYIWDYYDLLWLRGHYDWLWFNWYATKPVTTGQHHPAPTG